MAIKVQIPAGKSSVTVSGLFQWDYGQVLEIECAEIGSEILEVHFACPSMSEAVVRTCTFSNGVGTVAIPDQCLEQSSSVTAWVYKVDSTQGHTIKTIVLPITARTRPCNTRDVSADYVDKYGQLIGEVNEAINALENGDVTAANAEYANAAGKAANALSADYASKAGHATTAGSAGSATYATSAGHATTAGSATTANAADTSEQAAFLTVFDPVAEVTLANGQGTQNISLESNKLYLVTYNFDNTSCDSGLVYLEEGCSSYSILLRTEFLYCNKNTDGTFSISYVDSGATAFGKTGVVKFYEIGGMI